LRRVVNLTEQSFAVGIGYRDLLGNSFLLPYPLVNSSRIIPSFYIVAMPPLPQSALANIGGGPAEAIQAKVLEIRKTADIFHLSVDEIMELLRKDFESRGMTNLEAFVELMKRHGPFRLVELDAKLPPEVIARVHAWSPRKRDLFKTEHIQKAWERLQSQDWLPHHLPISQAD
jgi:hypothetical protein